MARMGLFNNKQMRETVDEKIRFFHAPQSRSSGVRVLLEELKAPYELCLLNMKAGEQREAEYLAVNPLGKVPALQHGKALITEQVAIFLYLADLFPEAGLSPAIGDPLRGPYLRWMAYYAGCYEPALVDRAMQREPVPVSMSPYGDFDIMFETVLSQITDQPYLLGEQFSAVDILWGLGFQVAMMFKIVPESPVVTRYVERVATRPAFQRVTEQDILWVAEHQAAMERRSFVV